MNRMQAMQAGAEVLSMHISGSPRERLMTHRKGIPCLNVQEGMLGDLFARDVRNLGDCLALCDLLHLPPPRLEGGVVCVLPQALHWQER